MLYVAQDFAYGMRIYSTAQAEQAVAGSVAQVRSEANLGQLRRVDDSAAQAAACSMAQADSLTTPTREDSTFCITPRRNWKRCPQEQPG
jgi:hypothetical protein